MSGYNIMVYEPLLFFTLFEPVEKIDSLQGTHYTSPSIDNFIVC